MYTHVVYINFINFSINDCFFIKDYKCEHIPPIATSSEKKEEIWLNPVTKTHTPTKQSKKQRDNIKTPPKTLVHNYCGPT